MQHCSKRHPGEIRDIDKRYPADVGPDGDHGPDERAKDEKNVQSGEPIIFQAELNRGEGEVKNYVEDKRQGDDNSDFFVEGKPEDPAEGNSNKNV